MLTVELLDKVQGLHSASYTAHIVIIPHSPNQCHFHGDIIKIIYEKGVVQIHAAIYPGME